MKKFLSFAIIMALLVAFAVPFAASAAEPELLFDLRPSKSLPKDVFTNVEGCEIDYQRDGTVIITLTATHADITLTFATSGMIYYGETFSLTEPAYFVADYASADGVYFNEVTQAHYTRKDKDFAAGAVADLWLTSVFNLPEYSVVKSSSAFDEATTHAGYIAWDLTGYTGGNTAKIIEEGHRFTSMNYQLDGPIGGKMYIYTFGLYDGYEIKGLGETRPEPTPADDPSEDPVESSAEVSSEDPSEDPVESSVDESSEVPSEDPVESSVDESSEVSSEAPSEEPSEAPGEDPSEAAPSEAATSEPASEPDPADDGGLSTGAIIGIIAAVVVVCGAVIFFIIKKRK